jgi:integrase
MSSRPLQPTATPGIYRRGGRYVVVLRDRSGRQFKRSARTLAEARTMKSTLSADLVRGELQETRRTTFEQYAAEWMRTYGGRTSKGIREITMRRYRTVIEREAVPLLGKLQMTDIEPRDIKRYAVAIADRGVSANTVRLYLAPLRALFATAVEDGLIRYNPAAGVRNVYGERREVEHENALTDAQLLAVLDAVPEPQRLLIRFLAETGLRISEAVALRWSDVDLDGSRLVVRRRYSQGTVDAPKSLAGRRQVPLSVELVAALSERRGEAVDDDPVFASSDGTPLDPANVLKRVMKPAARAAGVPWAHLHTLRHTCASRLFRGGWNAKQVQMILGHHSPAFTLSTYVHLMPDDLPAPLPVPTS